MQDDNAQILQRLTALEEEIKKLKSSSTIPHDVEGAFSKRLGIAGLAVQVSNKSASAENKTVNEAGASSYAVLNPPDRFVKVTINGTVNNLPAYD